MSTLHIWRPRLFQFIAIACLLFVVLTALAMFFYPGGTAVDPTSPGYSFLTNFFSDLGRTQSRSGATNLISLVLFVTALTGAGVGLILFFLLFPPFFKRTPFEHLISWLGSIAGITAGVCFIAVAWIPANLNSAVHTQLVYFAFEAFTGAALLYLPVMLRDRRYPKRYAFVFFLFAVLLVGYLYLLFFGPSPRTPEGLLIQAIGQKIIVYASIISVMIQSLGARQVLQRRAR